MKTQNYLVLSSLSPGVQILFFVIILLVSIGLIFLFMLGIRRERRRYIESKIEKDVNTIAWLEKFIHQLISAKGKKNRFFLYLVNIAEHADVKKAVGTSQYEKLLKRICDVSSKLQNFGVRVCIRNEKSILIYVRGGNIDLDKLSKLMIKNIITDETIKNMYNSDLVVNAACIAYPSGGTSFQSLVENLDLTMVAARRKGENHYAFYSADMSEMNSSEYKYYQEIKDAMKAKEFTLFFQPVVDVNTMDVVACESLIRWKHRTMGILPPSQFLYVMEQTGDINWVGLWCFEQTVKQLSQWMTNHENRFDIGINISDRQMNNADFAEEMNKIVRKYKASAENFVMEIKGETFFSTSAVAKENIRQLKEYGFKLAFDGFDGQQSSPVALSQLNFDIIKMDSKLWTKARHSSLAEDTILMFVRFSAENNKVITALGVENGEDIEFLKKCGVRNMQGYAFAPPKESRDFISDVLLTPWIENLKNPDYRYNAPLIQPFGAQPDAATTTDTTTATTPQADKVAGSKADDSLLTDDSLTNNEFADAEPVFEEFTDEEMLAVDSDDFDPDAFFAQSFTKDDQKTESLAQEAQPKDAQPKTKKPSAPAGRKSLEITPRKPPAPKPKNTKDN